MAEKGFVFEDMLKARKIPADVIIYKNGLTYFSVCAMETHGLADKQIMWGENEEEQRLAFQLVDSGRVFRSKKGNVVSCPAGLARRYAGRYIIHREDEVFVLDPVQSGVANES